MGLLDWLDASVERVRRRGLEGLIDVLYDLYRGVWWLAYPLPRGTNVYDLDWEVLVILDACRSDLLRSVSDEYDFLPDSSEVEEIESVGSMSKEWMAKTFTKGYEHEMSRTVYVNSNVFSEKMLSTEEFQELDEVWRYGWDDEAGTVPPRRVTDSAIQAAREHDPERLIVHYVQPHHPFLELDGFEARAFGPQKDDTVVDALRKGKIDRERYWEAYRENLRHALDEVELLLSNLEADEVVLSADHGDALGEWGIYDHPVGCLHPVVRRVPWVKTSARSIGDYEPATAESESQVSVQGRLKALGYAD